MMQTVQYIFSCFSHPGKRPVNEDSLITGTAGNNTLFMVCDGVGGQAKGEVASQLTCKTFLHFLKENTQREIDQSLVKEALSVVQNAFDNFINLNPDAEQMATTLTLTILHPAGISMAHLGDSRIYYFRNGNILYQTRDHSLINELVDNGIISPEEAESSPQKHIITRAVSTMRSQSAHPSFHLQTDVQPGDLLFLCSDGVTEALSTGALVNICTEHQNVREIMEVIESECSKRSSDNYSGIIIQITDN